jgi:CBS domain-containing protein
MKVRDILRTPYTYFEVNDTLDSIARVFNERHVASAPVVASGKYVGMVSDGSISKRFLPPKFLGIWTIGEPAPIALLRKATASELLEKGGFVVTPEDNLTDVLPQIMGRKLDCIPVVESKKSMVLVGIIRGSDVVRLFLQYFAAYAVKRLEKASVPERLEMETLVGRMLAIVDEEGVVPASSLAVRLGITRETAERIGSELEKHGLLRVHYRWFVGPEFVKIERTG